MFGPTMASLTIATTASSDSTLDCSIVIPSHNRPLQLAKCLEALAAQSFPLDRFEVVVVNDGSDQALGPVADRFRPTVRLQLVEQANAGPARARNVGAMRAASPLLAFTDDDCEPDREWVASLVSAWKRRPECALGGTVINSVPQNLYSTASQLIVDYLYEHQQESAGHNRLPPFFTTNNLAVSAALFRDLKGFDESFPLPAAEDREFCDRFQSRGHALVRVPEAIVRHAHSMSLSTFWRQQRNYGRGAAHFRRARVARGEPPVPLERWTFYRRLVSYPLHARRSGPRFRLAALIALSQLATAVGYMSENRRI